MGPSLVGDAGLLELSLELNAHILELAVDGITIRFAAFGTGRLRDAADGRERGGGAAEASDVNASTNSPSTATSSARRPPRAPALCPSLPRARLARPVNLDGLVVLTFLVVLLVSLPLSGGAPSRARPSRRGVLASAPSKARGTPRRP